MTTPNQYTKIFNDVIEGNYENYEADEIIELLGIADDDYHNLGEGTFFEFTDAQYDMVKTYAKRMATSHVYFTGVGSDVRGEKVDLPNPMSGLEQVEIGDTSKWIGGNDLMDEDIVVTDKMDGTSLQIIYDNEGELQIAYSRGNGIRGADVTRHIRRLADFPQTVSGPLEARFEVELSNTAFRSLQMKLRTSAGKRYKNPRNMTAGMMNKDVAPDEFYDNVDIFAYSVLNRDDLTKVESLELLENEGFNVVGWTEYEGAEITDEILSNRLAERKEALDYDIDGIVLTVNNNDKAAELDMNVQGAADPVSSVKYKVGDVDNYAEPIIAGVTYNISKHGVFKPQINYQPFDLQGVTISNSTGFNAGFIRDNIVGEGARALMTRSGDVIPYIIRVLEPATEWAQPETDLPCHWTESGVDYMLDDPDSHPEVRIQRMIDFCLSMEFPQLREGSVRKLFNAGFDTLDALLTMEHIEMVAILGANGAKAHDGMRARLNNVHFHDLIGSTSYFGRGLGKRKFKKLFESDYIQKNANNVPDLSTLTEALICKVEGFQETTANKVLDGLDKFNAFYENIQHTIQIAKPLDANSGPLAGEKIVCTGFRDKELNTLIEQNGGTLQSGVSGKTTLLIAFNPDETSGKITKAREKGVRIMSVVEFKEHFNSL